MMKGLLPLAALAGLAATPSFAATILTTQSVSAEAPGTTDSLSFAQFNPSQGTLNSVTLSFDANLPSVSGTLTNGSSASHTYSLAYNIGSGVSGNGFSLSSVLTSGTQSVGTVGAHASKSIGPFSGSGSDSGPDLQPCGV